MLVVDIETTGLCPEDDLIVEIGVVLLNTRTGRIRKKFYSLVNEGGFISKDSWIFENSDLKYKDVIKYGKSIKKIRVKLQKLFNKYSVTSYNQVFDFGFLGSRGFSFGEREKDPMLVLTDVLRIDKGYKNFKWPSVQEVLDFYGINIIEPHRALEDAKIEARIIYETIKRGMWY